MTSATREAQELQKAFDVFNQVSLVLSESYQGLQTRVESLTRELAVANGELRRQYEEKEALSERLALLLGGRVVLGANGFGLRVEIFELLSEIGADAGGGRGRGSRLVFFRGVGVEAEAESGEGEESSEDRGFHGGNSCSPAGRFPRGEKNVKGGSTPEANSMLRNM
jgi:hypothetical protein